jgi:glycosyltransferase involved in cell wall biosynthesis
MRGHFMKTAFVHDWLVTYAGAERVLEQMLSCFPEADLFSLVDFLPPGNRSFIMNKPVETSFIQNLPKARAKYRSYLPLMPLAIEQFDLSGYDLVISSSHAIAKGVLVGPDQIHICMCYSPIRYAWDLQFQYLFETNLERGLKSWLARWLLHKIRLWDVRTANAVDCFIAISYFISSRIEKTYRREATVIYPPVDVSGFAFRADKEDFYLTASRMVPYKKVAMIVDAFSSMPNKRLAVIGEGPEFEKCKAIAGSNVTLLGWQPFNVLKDYMQRAKAFVFAAEEDFGITPLEAQACGTPVIAFGKGAALETIRGLDAVRPTGVFFNEQTPAAIKAAVALFENEASRIMPDACRENVLRFSPERFRTEFTELVEREWAQFQAKRRGVGRSSRTGS